MVWGRWKALRWGWGFVRGRRGYAVQGRAGKGLAGTRVLAGAPTNQGSGSLPTHSASTPETWVKFTQENLCRAERERLASVRLRGLIDCILHDTAEDLRMQCDAVTLAFGRRLEELEDARHKLQHHLRKVRRATPRAAPRPHPGHTQGTPRPHAGLVQTSPGV